MGRSNDVPIIALATHTLTINTPNVPTAGYTDPVPGVYIAPADSTVVVTAYVNPGYVFFGFWAEFAGLRFLYQDSPHSFLMNTDYVVTPIFRIPTTLTVAAPSPPTGGGYPINEPIRFNVKLTETPSGVGIAGKAIQVIVTNADGTILWSEKTAIDDGGGNYHSDWTPTEVGTYKVYASWLGDPSDSPNILTGKYVGC